MMISKLRVLQLFFLLSCNYSTYIQGLNSKAEYETIPSSPSVNPTEDGDINLSPRIVGGTIAPKGKYPWFAAITDRMGTSWRGCGGMLIAPTYVLTAAHCVEQVSSSNISVLIGAYCLNSNNCGEPKQKITVSRIVPHPDFDSISFDNDFAILKLSFSADADPVMIDTGKFVNSYSDKKRDLYAIGFGSLYYGGMSVTQLRHVELKFVPRGKCNNHYGGSITETMMCAADPGQDSCQGDSGGPLYDEENEVVVGVVSWGVGCADSKPGVYAQTSTTIDWIIANICDNEDPSYLCDRSESPSLSLTPSTSPSLSHEPSNSPTSSPAPSNGCAVGFEHELRIAVTTDNFPFENYWTIEYLNGTLINSDGPFTDRYTTHHSKLCLDTSQCYIYTIFDTFGDGIWSTSKSIVVMDGTAILETRDSFSSISVTLGDGCPSVAPSLSHYPSLSPSLVPSVNPTRSIIPTSYPSSIPSPVPSLDCSDDQLTLRISISSNDSGPHWKLYHVQQDGDEILLQEKVYSSQSKPSSDKLCLDQSKQQCYRVQIQFQNGSSNSNQEFDITVDEHEHLTMSRMAQDINTVFIGTSCPSSQPSMGPTSTSTNGSTRTCLGIKKVMAIYLMLSQFIP